MEPTPNTQHPYAQPSSPMQPVPPLAQLSPQTVHPQAAPTVAGIQSLTTLSRAASLYRPYEIVQVTNVLMGGLLPALMAFILGIYAFKVSGKTKTKTSASSRTTTFGSLAIVLGGLSILGLIGSAVLYVLAFF